MWKLLRTLSACRTVHSAKSFEAVFGAAFLCGSPDYEAEIRGALEYAESENKVLLAAGSFYLAAEVKKCLQTFG